MIVIFYNADTEKIYVCSETEPTKVISIDDPDIMDHIPNDDILYVQNAHFITKKQFRHWLEGDMELEVKEAAAGPTRFSGFLDDGRSFTETTKHSRLSGRLYIHPAHNGTILIEDIHTERYPHGIQLSGKWDFIAIDEVGEETLKESVHFRTLQKKGKIEVVDDNYVKNNKHRMKQKTSPSEAALNAILIPPEIKAEAAAERGGIHALRRESMLNDGAIEIIVDR